MQFSSIFTFSLLALSGSVAAQRGHDGLGRRALYADEKLEMVLNRRALPPPGSCTKDPVTKRILCFKGGKKCGGPCSSKAKQFDGCLCQFRP